MRVIEERGLAKGGEKATENGRIFSETNFIQQNVSWQAIPSSICGEAAASNARHIIHHSS